MEKPVSMPDNYEYLLKVEYLKIKDKFNKELGNRDPLEYISHLLRK